VSNGSATLDLRGERVRIRWWNYKDDITQRSWPRYDDPFSALWNIPRTMSFYGSLRAFSAYGSNIRRVWAIENSEGTLIGRISLRDVDEQVTQQARLGISLGAPYVGQGLGTEAMIVFLDHFFGPMGFRKMVLDVAAFNRRAVHCYERLGFRCLSDEWRKSGSHSVLRHLDNPASRDLLPYFRREHSGVWVQFLEMELDQHEWLEHSSTLQRAKPISK
jgi:RimJ/RimL family protein N-acetyltransferase